MDQYTDTTIFSWLTILLFASVSIFILIDLALSIVLYKAVKSNWRVRGCWDETEQGSSRQNLDIEVYIDPDRVRERTENLEEESELDNDSVLNDINEINLQSESLDRNQPRQNGGLTNDATYRSRDNGVKSRDDPKPSLTLTAERGTEKRNAEDLRSNNYNDVECQECQTNVTVECGKA